MSDETLLRYFDAPTVETRRAGFIAADAVRGAQAQKLFSLLVQSPDGLSNNELSRQAGIRICAVTARMVELRRVELPNGGLLIEASERRRDRISGVVNVVWRVNPEYFVPSKGVGGF